MNWQKVPERHHAEETTHAYALPWIRLLHPFPSLLVTLAAAVFAELAMRGQAPADKLVRLVLAVACSQCAIGSVNDVVDRDLDRLTKAWKPVARGAVSVGAAMAIAVACSIACLALSASLSLATLIAAAVGLGCGLGYDLYLKRSRWSWLPYGLAIPTVPVWAWAAMGKLTANLIPAYPLGLLLGLSLHLANTLPDLEGDQRFGVAGLAHGLGKRVSLLLCWGALALAQILTLLLWPALHYHSALYPVGLGLSWVLLAAAIVLYRARPVESTLQLNFGIVAVATLVLATGWLAGSVA